MEQQDIIVFCDFDGTVTQKDLGDELFKQFGEFEPHHTRLKRGDMTVAEYWQTVCATLPPDMTAETIRNFALEQPVDPYFRSFAALCREKRFPLYIVSDGFDAYIHPILQQEGIENTLVFCNRLVFLPNIPPQPVFPLANESCQCFCASCKRNAVLSVAAPESIIVFIGDGLSDTCVAEHADIVFAKNTLAAYCTKQRIPHHPYHTFFDVARIMKTILAQQKIRPRHQAHLKRKKAFEIE